MATDRQLESSYKYDLAVPNASALVESLRAFGYSLETAIADLVDNSITAKAKNIAINFQWDGRGSKIVVSDDGEGMSDAELKEAMRPGTRSPLEERESNDLGRFGLGLKTASFSQGRKLTVLSACEGSGISSRTWDLDYIQKSKEWRLIKNDVNESDVKLLTSPTGTIIIWEKLDRVVGSASPDNEQAYRRFLESIETVQTHLTMVFHRFLTGPSKIKITVNNREISAWDPFLSGESATQQLPTERLTVNGQNIYVTPFVLPHRSKISDDKYKLAAGPRGWNAQQGIYVYRNERLLVPGDWLGLGFQKEEHYKLARIMIDLPNTLDADWKIDVKKSSAKPPGLLRSDLKRIAMITRERAVSIYRHRGKIIARKNSHERVFVWQQKKRRGKIVYSINRNHPAIAEYCSRSAEASRLLTLIEETVPSAHILITASEQSDEIAGPLEGFKYAEFENLMIPLFDSFITSGCSEEEALERIASIEPFNSHPEFIQTFREKLGED